MIDIASQLDPAGIERAVNEADARNLIRLVSLRPKLAAYPGQWGVARLRDVIDSRTFRLTDSELERRFLRLANPRLSDLISSRIGDDWLTNLDDLRDLEPLADNPEFRAEWRRVKQRNKQLVTLLIQDRTGVTATTSGGNHRAADR